VDDQNNSGKREGQNWYDQRIENIIAQLLRAGVLLAATVVIAGAVFYLATHGREHVSYRHFQGEPEALRTIQGILRSAFSGSPLGIMQLGLLLLIATPVARVAFSAVAFAKEHDFMYVGFTLIVLTVLLYSLLGSFLIA
jgi:uncharacterized membrane protein